MPRIPGSNVDISIILETKLLGYWLTTDLKPNKHVEYILKIAYKRIWAIGRLKSAGVSNQDILYFYCLKIRSVLETACPIFHSMLTIQNRDDLERVQKIVFKVILSEKYTSYENSCKTLNMETLDEKRTNISLKFALKCLKHNRLSYLFPRNNRNDALRKQEKFKVPQHKTSRYRKSPVPYLISLLNDHLPSI